MGDKRLKIWLDGYNEDEWKEIEIEFPLYIQCYEEALTAILDTIEYNSANSRDSRENSSGLGRKVVFAGMESGYTEKREYTEPLEKSNMIAFVGDRGGGKSTALNEFCGILHDYSENYKKWESKIICNNLNRYAFHILAPIDASVLETKEDLMEVILASMFEVLQKKMDNYKRPVGKSDLIQKIIREFDDVYRDYINVGNRDREQLMGESVLAKLKYISNSLKTKTLLESLIIDFLELLDGEKTDKSYLVIAIDDLDMSPENGYAMLDQLHKYLANSRVIILVAVKYEQIKMICDQHFADCITPKYGGVHKSVYNQYYKKAQQLSSDYLLKVLPRANRIYMPDGSLLDKRGNVRTSDDSESKYTVKEFILTKIADKMKIYYDAAGVKRHFCIPDGVRELAFYDQFLDSLYSMEEIERKENNKKEKQMLMYDQNHERFNSDIEYKMAVRILDNEQLELYREIMKTSVERRAQYTVNFLRSWMEEKEKERENPSYKKGELRLKDRVDGQPYCYADLLSILYDLGREDHNDKALVHCILASFTAEMVREYYSYKYNPDRDAKNRSAVRLKKFLGNTFGGMWFEAYMPKLRRTVESSKIKQDVRVKIGYIPDVSKPNIEIDLGADIFSVEEKQKWVMETVNLLFPCIERFVFLFSNFRDAEGRSIEPKWDFKITQGKADREVSMKIKIFCDAERADFDIFGFIGKEIKEVKEEHNSAASGEDSLDCKLANNCVKAVGELFEELKLDSEKQSELLKELKNILGAKSMENLKKSQNEDVVFPFYSLDMSYNIMKRVRKKLRENIKLKEKNAYDYYCKVYEYIANGLKEDDDYYNRDGEKVHFLKDFLDSPYMQAFEITVGGVKYNQQKDKKIISAFWEAALEQIGKELIAPNIQNQDIL